MAEGKTKDEWQNSGRCSTTDGSDRLSGGLGSATDEDMADRCCLGMGRAFMRGKRAFPEGRALTRERPRRWTACGRTARPLTTSMRSRS